MSEDIQLRCSGIGRDEPLKFFLVEEEENDVEIRVSGRGLDDVIIGWFDVEDGSVLLRMYSGNSQDALMEAGFWVDTEDDEVWVDNNISRSVNVETEVS